MRLTPQAGQAGVAIKEWGWAQNPPSSWSTFREWTRLDGAVQRSDYRRGSVIYAVGDPSDIVFLLKSGKVKILRHGPYQKQLIVQLIGAGEVFGEGALLGETHRENSAEALEETTLWTIPRKPLLDWLTPRPEVWLPLATLLGRRLRSLENSIDSLMFLEVEQRLVRVLVALSAQYGEPGEDGLQLRIPLSQRELAHLIGSTRETTSSILNRLCKQGLVRIRRRKLAICSLDRLTALAEAALPPKRPPRAEERMAAAAARGAAGESR